MKKHLMICCLLMALGASTAMAAVKITGQTGWMESACVTWQKQAGLTYNVYISAAGAAQWTKLDDQLVREYPTYGRADALGLKAGSYQLKVVPVSNGSEQTADAAVSEAVTVKAHDRSGFAHVGMSGGIGAYKNDGTLKDGARVIYVWADNAKSVTLDVVTGSKGTTTTGTGLQDIVALYQKGYETRPLAIRIVGTIKAADMDRFDSSSEGLQVKGKGAYSDMPITIEGVGQDAAFWGFGILCRNAKDVEFRNFAIMLCMDDCLSLDTSNSNVWVHNMDFYYGNTGGDADQAKGDGTVDIKGKSKNITVSYNHFVDCGKTSLGGMKSEDTSCWMTFHHNWFDHSDSRHPRIRTAFYHVYNNYFDGVSKYGVGVTSGGSAFVENNLFRNCKYPILISKQGTDAEGDGTFSGEDGGVAKAYNNKIEGARKIQYWSSAAQVSGQWDAVLVDSRDEAVSATALTGGTGYNSEADQALRTTYIENNIDSPDDVKAIVKGEYGAGRMQRGDFRWSFNNSVQDANYSVISELKQALQQYKSTLVGFFGDEPVSNGGATAIVDGGDGKGISDEVNDSFVPTWAGGSGATTSAGLPDKNFCGPETEAGSGQYDFYWFNSANNDKTAALFSDGHLAASDGYTYKPAEVPAASGDGSATTTQAGYINIVKSTGTITFKCDNGLLAFSARIFRTGGANGEIQISKDGTTFTKLAAYSETKGEKTISASASEKDPVYVRITNAATGGLSVLGVKITYPDPNGSADTPDPEDPEPADTRSDDSSAEFTVGGEEVPMTDNAYTLTVPYNADDASGYTVTVAPAENAAVKSVDGATGANGTYTIGAPAAGQSATATFVIVAENEQATTTYTVTIVKEQDPANIVVETGDVKLQAGSIPDGYKVDGSATVSAYTYSSDLCSNANLFTVAASQHTVTIPVGASVTKVVMYAVGDNNTAAKGKITELAGKTFSVDLPSRKTGTSFATATVDNVALTGSFTFTVTYRSGVKFDLTVEKASTGISTVSTVRVGSDAVYTTGGQRVAKPHKGLYISGGKKVIVK